MAKASIDVFIRDGDSSVVAFRPMSCEARQWFAEFVQSEPWQWLGPYLCVDWRYANDLVAGLDAEGFNVVCE